MQTFFNYFRKSFLLLLFSFTYLFAGVPDAISVNKTSDGYVINFTLPDYNTFTTSSAGNEFVRIDVPGFGITPFVGKPELPILSFNLFIPYDENRPVAEIISSEIEQKLLTNKIYPKQQPWSKNKSLSDRPFVFDYNFYDTFGNSNEPVVTLSEPFIIAGTKGVIVTIHPFRYNPVNNTLKVTKTLSFKIKLEKDFVLNNYISPAYNKFFKESFVNYEGMNPTSGSRLLIITAPDYESAIEQFVNYKTSVGFEVELYNTNVTGTSKESIKNFIQQRYNNQSTRPEYVLLVGDINKIPVWLGDGEGNPPTDIKYVQLDGDDHFPDAFIGRFSVSDAEELERIISKTIFMENFVGALQKRNVYMASEDNWFITENSHNFVIENYFDPDGYNNLKLYSHTYNATTSDVIDAINSNKQFVIYSGHGSEHSWYDGPLFTQNEVEGLVNDWYPFVFSFACQTGAYQIAESFGETWLRVEHGASAFYGASVDSYWEEDDNLERRVFQTLFDEGLTEIAPVFERGILYLINYYGGLNETTLRYLEMYNLMGDPSLSIYKEIPPDSNPPEAITDLSVVSSQSNSLTLNWTAPFDSTLGGVASYDIRYAENPILSDNDFNTARQLIFSGQSDSAGTYKSYTIEGLDFNTVYYIAIKALDVWGNTSEMSNTASGQTLYQPSASVYPDSLHIYALPDSNTVDSVIISNVSNQSSTLNYTVELSNSVFPAGINILPKYESLVSHNPVIKGGEDVRGGMSVTGGGSDSFGYNWIDSNEPQGPEFEWNDISSDPDAVNITTWQGNKDDGFTAAIPLGFGFKYYGITYTYVYVSTNGFISFSPLASSYFDNTPVPQLDVPNNSIFAFWDDLDGRFQGSIHYLQQGNRFIVQFTNWQRYSGSGSFSFQIVLKSNGKIFLYYKGMYGIVTSATVGIENALGSDGLQIAFNSEYLESNLAVEIGTDPEWLNITETGGTLYNGNSASIVLNINTEDLEYGDYSMDMLISTNDPDNPEITIPVILTVTDNVTSADDNKSALPTEFALYQNYPNPFNPGTTIRYAVSKRQYASLKVYDILGNEVASLVDEVKEAGTYEVNFNAESLTSGVYFYRFETGDFVNVKKMLLVK